MKERACKAGNRLYTLLPLLLLLFSACRPPSLAPAALPTATFVTPAPTTLPATTATARATPTTTTDRATATAVLSPSPATVTIAATSTTAATASSITAATTSTAVPAATLPPSSPTPALVSGPQIASFSATGDGDGVLLAWEAGGGNASICPVVAGDPLSCNCLFDLPLTGTARVTAAEIIGNLSGFALSVSDGDSIVRAEAPVAVPCPNQDTWFPADPPAMCPSGDPIHSAAAAQSFEHGQMIWLQATDTYYLLYDHDLRVTPGAGTSTLTSLGIISGPLALEPGASADNRVGETPPAGLFEPVSGFGLLWRDEVVGTDHVRAALGWATAPEFAFNSSYQCAHHCGASWNCYLLGPDGSILHLTFLLHFGHYWERR
jgi:hypothetical protein